ncbi:hypothetical protein PACTADRAFT_28613, partial [Pachysolen tannophilus NRRL Y-2460]
IIRIKNSSQKQSTKKDNGLTNEDIDDEENELPYNGILSFEDANSYFTAPSSEDRDFFNRALKDSEMLRYKNSDLSRVSREDAYLDSVDEEALAYHGNIGPVSKIKCIHISGFEIDTWYTAPYPEEYSSKPVLHICEYCLKYMNSKFIAERHALKCNLNRHPPGNEIYRWGKNAIFEIDGRKNTIYCQNLCLLAKLFLNSKTLYYDVEPFMFYVLTEIDEFNNFHFVGYFSKEKLNSTNYNVSCILTLPIYQRKGYGNLLIDFSYLLTRREFKYGTPEKPLSDLGLLSYKNYWKVTVCFKLKEIVKMVGNTANIQISIHELSNSTGIIQSDIVTALENLNFLIRDPVTGNYAISVNMNKVCDVIEKWEAKNYTKLNPDRLLFKPVIFGPSGGINTTTTMGNRLMNGISIITNFMKDDIDDIRNIEDQTLEEITNRTKENFRTGSHSDGINNGEEDDDDEQIGSRYLLCYPGMNLVKGKKNNVDVYRLGTRTKRRKIVLDESDEEESVDVNNKQTADISSGDDNDDDDDDEVDDDDDEVDD